MISCIPETRCFSDASCSSQTDNTFQSYDEIVDSYILRHRDRANRELDFYHGAASLEDAVRLAAFAKTREGKRHPHQRRLNDSALAESERRLQACDAELRLCDSFADLYCLVDQVIGCIGGIGPLMVYDVALRLGSYLGKEPEEVFLHRGTAIGAKNLGLDHRRITLDPKELPPAFHRLLPREAEDCLCIYKSSLRVDFGAAEKRRDGR